jgi:putative Holliday junction resolvase
MPGTPETIIAFDFGLRRIGVAVGQQVTNSANPLGAIGNGDDGPDWERIASLVREWQPARLIVGLPLHADGTPSELGKLATAFIHDLARFDLPVDAVDESYTSLEAEALLKTRREQGLRGRIGKADIDAAAATLIAERWLKKEHQ